MTLRRSLSWLFHWSPRLRFPGMESQQTTIKWCCTMLIYLSLASVWPRSVDNYPSLALTHKLIMKDKQSSACQLPLRIRSHIKFLPLSTELQALGLVPCQRMSNMELTWCISPHICLPKTVLFLTYEEEEKEEEVKEENYGWSWGVVGGWRYLFMVETLPVFTTHSTARVPISYSLSCTVICVTEQAAGWGLTGSCGTERRLRHASSDPKRNESTLKKLKGCWYSSTFLLNATFL